MVVLFGPASSADRFRPLGLLRSEEVLIYLTLDLLDYFVDASADMVGWTAFKVLLIVCVVELTVSN